jgi:chorismate mutase
MSERQRLPKLVENNKVVSIKKEMNGIIEEILKENETDITDLNHLIFAAASVIMEEVTKPGKAVKSRRNKTPGRLYRGK